MVVGCDGFMECGEFRVLWGVMEVDNLFIYDVVFFNVGVYVFWDILCIDEVWDLF